MFCAQGMESVPGAVATGSPIASVEFRKRTTRSLPLPVLTSSPQPAKGDKQTNGRDKLLLRLVTFKTCHSIAQSYVRFCSGYRQSQCMSLL